MDPQKAIIIFLVMCLSVCCISSLLSIGGDDPVPDPADPADPDDPSRPGRPSRFRPILQVGVVYLVDMCVYGRVTHTALIRHIHLIL